MKHTHRSAAAFTRPVNLGAERAVLGAVLLCPALLTDVLAAGLAEGDFSLSAHREIYRAMLEIHAKDAPVDIISLVDQLGPRVENIGGATYLSDLPGGAIPQRKHVLFHAGLVMTKARLRQIVSIGGRAMNAACEPGADPFLLAGEICAELTEIAGQRGTCPDGTRSA